jgi:hypothetical protein
MRLLLLAPLPLLLLAPLLCTAFVLIQVTI